MNTINENVYQVLKENFKQTTNGSFFDFVKQESESDPNFFRTLFSEDFEQDFDSSLNDEQRSEWDAFLASLELDEKMDKYIVVSLSDSDEYAYITRRENFEKVIFCDCYGKYGQNIGCNHAGCYNYDNTESSFFKDFFKTLNSDIQENFEMSFIEDIINNEVDESDPCSLDFDEIRTLFERFKEQNESHTEVTAWTFHDSHNFCTYVLETPWGESDCKELEEEQQRAILAEFTGAPRIFSGTSASEETEHYIFTSTAWADDPWICSVEYK